MFSIRYKYISYFFILLTITCSFYSCTTLPELPESPKKYDPADMAQIKLINADTNGFTERFGGDEFELSCCFIPVIPIRRHLGAIAFNEDFIVYVDESWETYNGKFLDRKYKFNDNAVFNIPAGEYTVCAYKLATYPSKKIIKKCVENKTFKFEPGDKYEMYITYYTSSKTVNNGRGYTTTYTWLLNIADIRKVENFKPAQLNFK